MINNNMPVEEADKMVVPEPYKDWWFDIFFVSNIKFMYHYIQNQE